MGALFTDYGAHIVRSAYVRYLDRVLRRNDFDFVVLGSSALMDRRSRLAVRENIGTLVWLRTSTATALARLRGDPHHAASSLTTANATLIEQIMRARDAC